MAGPDPAIHVLSFPESKTWMPATSAGMTEETNGRKRVEKMDFDLSEEQRLLRDNVERLAAATDAAPAASGWSRERWN